MTATELLKQLGTDCIRVVIETETRGPTRRDRKRAHVHLYRMDDVRWPTYAGNFGGTYADEQEAIDALIRAGFGSCGRLGSPECRVNGQIIKPVRTPSDGFRYVERDRYDGLWTPEGVIGREPQKRLSAKELGLDRRSQEAADSDIL